MFLKKKDDGIQTSAEVIDRWELIKAQEKKAKGEVGKDKFFKNLPPRLPALLFAYDIYKRAKKHGLAKMGNWSQDNIEDQGGDFTEAKAGQKLFEIVAICKENGIDPESALRQFSAQQIDLLSKVETK